ncbi:hypothetical protein I553_1328 [Mycobacterium xenopi 4042]|uniref:Uncharacterized protein n=1 Tax=Mycobacterium xenopi 4042 TaxID=1299334 RepID=X8CET4_MYCXE|nr:hypothetical protein I553_1328 [Mycobacterium xenopi 4042]
MRCTAWNRFLVSGRATAMRFDEFTEKHGLVVSPVNRFAGFLVEVGAPKGWEPFDSAPGFVCGLVATIRASTCFVPTRC